MREHFFLALTVVAGKDKENLPVFVQLKDIVSITNLGNSCDVLLTTGTVVKCANTFEDLKRRTDQYGLMKVL
jgi:hypothetical protein